MPQKFFFSILFILAISTVNLFASTENQNPDYDHAISLGQHGDTEGAKTIFQSIVRNTPTHAGANFELGMLASQESNFGTAKKYFEQAVRSKDDMLPAHYNLGLVLMKLGDFEYARDEFKKVISLDPHNPSGFYQIGIAYETQGFLEEAEEAYKEALRINPDFRDARDHLKYVRDKIAGGGESEAKFPDGGSRLLSAGFGNSGAQGSPVDQLTGGASGQSDGKGMLFQAGSALVQQWLNSRNKSSDNNSN